MKMSLFVATQFANELFTSGMEQYRHNLTTISPSSATPIYAGAINAMQKLSKNDQDALIAFLNVVIADTASTIFGALDGSSDVYGLTEEFSLSYGGHTISGYMQESFLEVVEAQARA